MLGNRRLKQVLKAVTEKQNYTALINMRKYYPDFLKNAFRYITASGTYPYYIRIKTPTGIIKPRLYSHHDLLTVNEIFCRLDYPADGNIKVVVDIGSNIGISALYFLTRNNKSICYLYEPDKRNIEKLKLNLSDCSGRYILHKKAVSFESGQFEFGIEPTGRYGSLGVNAKEKIIVDCIEINDVIRIVLEKEECIDILKIDTEGVEIKTVEAINSSLLKRIRKIYLEAKPEQLLHPDTFIQKQHGSVCQLVEKQI
jgi:FkbM family methyltransferase